MLLAGLALGFEHDAVHGEGGGGDDVAVGPGEVHDAGVVLHGDGVAAGVHLADAEMGVEAEDFFAQLAVEAAHDADDDDEDGDAEVTPRTEMRVMMETKVRLGRR